MERFPVAGILAHGEREFAHTFVRRHDVETRLRREGRSCHDEHGKRPGHIIDYARTWIVVSVAGYLDSTCFSQRSIVSSVAGGTSPSTVRVCPARGTMCSVAAPARLPFTSATIRS